MKHIINDIEHYTSKDYDKIVSDFIQFFAAKYGDSISLYQIGSAGFPSVSDLDLAIIIDESKLNEPTIRSIIKDANEFVYQNEARRYIFTHSTLKYPIKTFSYNQYFEYMPNATLLHGQEIPIYTEEKDKMIIDDIMFIIYEANTLRDFERLRAKKHVGLRELLKVYQRAYYHLSRKSYQQNTSLNIDEMLEMSNHAKTIRLEAIHHKLTPEYQKLLISLFDKLYLMIKSSYHSQMVLLSKKIMSQSIDKDIFVLSNKRLVKKPLSLLYMGALYAREFSQADNCYADIHQLIYPLDISSIQFHPHYVQNIQKQAEILKPVCSFYKRFGVKVSGPLLCYYCTPNITWKSKVRYTIQKILYRIQGVKTI